MNPLKQHRRCLITQYHIQRGQGRADATMPASGPSYGRPKPDLLLWLHMPGAPAQTYVSHTAQDLFDGKAQALKNGDLHSCRVSQVSLTSF